MNTFIVKKQNGMRKEVNATSKTISQTACELELAAALNWSEIEYVEFPMHDFKISVGDEGYYLVPAGNPGYANREYGIGYFSNRPDRQGIFSSTYMALYGFKYHDLCRAVIVTGMRYDVSFILDVKNGEYRMLLRFMTLGEAPYENIKLELHDINDGEAGYSDMARIYREYQLAHGFRAIRDRLTPELKYAAESPNIRVRMAWKPVPCKIIHQTPENEPPVHTACSFDDLIELMNVYHALGIDKAEFCLVGWNMKGHDGRWPQALPVEESIGGEEGLKRLLDHAKALGYAVCCHTNSTDAYTIADCFNKDDLLINAKGELDVEATRWGGGRTYNVCPKVAYETADRMLKPIEELGFHGTHYIDVITCVPAKRCYSESHPVNKKESCEYFDRLFTRAKELFGAVGSEGAYDHSLKNCDTALYASFLDYKNPSPSQRTFCDKEIPLFQLVYHGIVLSNPYSRTVNAILGERDDMLKVIEYGGRPQMYYYARFVDDGSDWIGKVDFFCHTDAERRESALKVKETLDILREFAPLQYEFMEKHDEIADGVFVITYSDGSVVTVDYNKQTYTLKKGEAVR